MVWTEERRRAQAERMLQLNDRLKGNGRPLIMVVAAAIGITKELRSRADHSSK